MTTDDFASMAAAVDKWYGAPRAFEKMVFGAESALVEAIRLAASNGDFAPALTGIDQLLREEDKVRRCLHDDSGYPVRRGCAVLQGLRSTFLALKHYSEHRPPDEDQLTAHFTVARGCFQLAWGERAARPGGSRLMRSALGHEDWIETLRDDVMWRVLAQAGQVGTDAGFWILFDLVDRLCGQLRGQPPKARMVGAATTPVLLVKASPPEEQSPPEGYALWLSVELFEGPGCGFDPDPLSLGLTAVRSRRHRASNTPRVVDFVDSLREVWRKSGVADRYRGRWRISAACPISDPRFADFVPRHMRRVDGPSAEAAALAAIWAASGQVPYAEVFDSVGGLALDVAISASVGDRPAGEPPTAIPLQRVGSVGSKIEAAKERGLDRLLLAENEERTGAENTIDKQQQKQDYHGLHIKRMSTMGDALDWMLQTNRCLRHWHENVEKKWTDRWRDGTGKFDAMGVASSGDASEE